MDIFVRHRIDGLEKRFLKHTEANLVRHRIDGLETHQAVAHRKIAVRHRIDGLEMCFYCFT